MNLENLEKDESIHEVLRFLIDRFGVESFKLKDFWEADLFAIGLSDPSERQLVSISTYRRPMHRYFVSLEKLAPGVDAIGAVVGECEDVGLEELAMLFEGQCSKMGL